MPTIIEIPRVERDTIIGSVFNSLFSVINKTEIADPYDPIIWDFSNSTFFHPFYICGLSLYRIKSDRIIYTKGIHSYTSGYLDAINFSNPRYVKSSDDVNQLFDLYTNKSYIPLCKFKSDEDSIDSVSSGLQRIIERQCRIPGTLISPLSYLLGELVTNIHDHSRCGHGYMFSQYLSKEKCLNLCIADFGITIFGSFASSGIFDTRELINEGVVLNMALGHKSTKNRPKAENRGYGLPTSKAMLVDGMGGEFFILSGGAFHRHDKNGEATVTLPKELYWDGTIILLKIPMVVEGDFNYLKYVERL